MPAFAIHTLGCKVNTYESDIIAQQMKNSGFTEVGFTEKADVYIINTCTVTNIADRKSRQMLHRAKKMNPSALIIATGCYVDSVGQGKGSPENAVDLWIPNREKSELARTCLRYLSGLRDAEHTDPRKSCRTPGEKDLRENRKYPEGVFLTELDGHTRAFIKIEDGCGMFCSYCIIPYVRGNVTARPAEDTVREVKALAESGIREIVLTGIHLSSMGKQLVNTIREINAVEGIERIRIGSLEPRFITPDVVAQLSECEKLCPHFHLSLQSGSDRILKAMKRRYSTAEFMESCIQIRKVWPDAAITTDIIVGFPGETEEDFEESCAFVRKVMFYEAHIFRYSRRKGTAADLMKEQLTEKIKAERSRRLMELTEEQSSGFRARFLGRELEFLAEETVSYRGTVYVTGFTKEYIRVILPENGVTWRPGDILKGRAEERADLPNLGEVLVCG